MEEDQVEQDPSIVNFIPCISFVKRGVAKENPDKVCLHQFSDFNILTLIVFFFLHILGDFNTRRVG